MPVIGDCFFNRKVMHGFTSEYRHKKSSQAFELAFPCDNIEELDSSYKKLISAGAGSVHPPENMPWGMHNVFFSDPDGNIHEIFVRLEKMAENSIKLLSGMTWVLTGAVNIGIAESTHGVYLIDSGNDQDSGRKLLQQLQQKDWKVKAIINTHSNVDLSGANSYLQRKTDCAIWATKVEADFIETPVLEPSFLWGGYPFKELRSKFFEAKASRVTNVITEDTVLPGFRFIPLPGHHFGQIGVFVDDVFFLGDSLSGKNIIDKYGLPFIYNVRAFKSSIEKIKAIDAEYYVPSHGEIVKNIEETAELNMKTVLDTENDIMRLIEKWVSFDDLLKSFCDLRGIDLNQNQYVLVGSTVKSFLSYLFNKSEVSYAFKDNIMYWKCS